MWAINPMLRIFLRSIFEEAFEATVVAIRVKSDLSGVVAGGVDDPPELQLVKLPAVVDESPVGLGHSVKLFTPAHSGALSS